ncbi:MAG: hypothetical protein K2F99_09740, partial [Muribaculaceae bacterium]|nr:hypothetical protein [Muribaculaceae bacterium]
MRSASLISLSICALTATAQTALRVNQVGYLPSDIKAAVYIGNVNPSNLVFELSEPEQGIIA